MREMRELRAECGVARGGERQEHGHRATEGLAPILETGEDEEEEEGGEGGEEEGVSKEAVWQSRLFALEEEIKRLVAERETRDDDDGIEEVKEWTWQAAADNQHATHTLLGAKPFGEIFVKDGEHVITTIPNDVEIASPIQTCGECSGQSRDDMPALTEVQYMEEKLKLERIIDELEEQKSSLERELDHSRETVANAEVKFKALSADLDVKTVSETESLRKAKELENQLSELESKVNSLEKLLVSKNDCIRELETEVGSLKNDLLSERKCNDDVEQCMVNLKAQISQLETSLKIKDECLTENEKLVNNVEGRLKEMERNAMLGKEESLKLVSCLEGKVATLETALEVEVKLKEEALRDLEEARRLKDDLEHKLAGETQLKEKALSELVSVEERYQFVEQQETISKDELSSRIVELEMTLCAIQEKAKLEQIVKDEAIERAGTLEAQVKQLDKELSTSKGNLQEKDVLICELVEKLKSLEMERERIMSVVGDKAREVSSLRSEKQRLMEAMTERQREMSSEWNNGVLRSDEKDGSCTSGTELPPGEKESTDPDDDGTVQLLTKLTNLQLESEQLAESYRQEQQRNKHLQNEVHELLEKETALHDELQRLRVHLLGVEDRYTKEAVSAEEQISLLKSKLTQVEERLHASSSAYTSASVRSNQQVESLENQIRMLTEKRDESKSRLIAAEEQLSQQAKDLINLQSVLEQFQKDKEREISLVKDKMGTEISSWEKKCCTLSEEIKSIQEQLNQAKEGLSAAARLSEQADKKSEIIASLKTELKKLNASLKSAEERLQDASLNVEGKVDRNLVKNLLLGYLSSPAQGSSRRHEILRIIATILEFSQEEKAKADLLDSKSSGWLRGLAAGWASAREPTDLTQPSLSEAFIRFLESESRPKTVPQLHTIVESRAESTTQSSTPTLGHSRTSSTSSTPPLLLTESVLPTLPTFTVTSGSNSSCILKDVLKES